MFCVVKDTNIDFVKICKPAMMISSIFIIAGLAVFVKRGDENFSHDLVGGTLAHINLKKEMSAVDARAGIKKLEEKGFKNVGLQSFGLPGTTGYTSFVLRTKKVEPENTGDSNVKTALQFKKAIAESFSLVSDGITKVTQLEKRKDGRHYWELTINLLTERTIKEIEKALSSTELKDVSVRAIDMPRPSKDSNASELTVTSSPVSSAIITCTVPTTDNVGKPRVEKTAQEQFIRSQLGSLRTNKLLSFTDPFSRFTSVGPAVAGEMKSKAILALIYSMVAIFFYIWLRFQFKTSFGFGACIALIHDVLFTIGVISIADEYFGLNIQIDLTIVAALLTIVGYSLNDTIVVIDRIRENIAIGEIH